MKVLILAVYYDRPHMVRTALESIKRQNSENWELSFIDDGSTIEGRPIVEEILAGDLHRTRFYNTNDTVDNKRLRGSIHGQFINEAIKESDADICIILCDDDALYPGYIDSLVEFYSNNSYIVYSYCHVSIFDPTTFVGWSNVSNNLDTNLNGYHIPINCSCLVDASQVSWRRSPVLEADVLFPSPQTAALDATFYQKMFDQFGPAVFNGIIGQYKGIFPDQMGRRSDLFTVRED